MEVFVGFYLIRRLRRMRYSPQRNFSDSFSNDYPWLKLKCNLPNPSPRRRKSVVLKDSIPRSIVPGSSYTHVGSTTRIKPFSSNSRQHAHNGERPRAIRNSGQAESLSQHAIRITLINPTLITTKRAYHGRGRGRIYEHTARATR